MPPRCMHRYRRPQPRTQKERRANRLGLDRTATVEYRNRLVRIKGPRAQGRRPPPDTCVETRAFNAPAQSVTGSVIGNEHLSNRSCLQPCPPNEPEHGRAQRGGRNIPSRPPSRHPKSALCSAKLCAAPDPRAGVFLLRKESGDKGRRPNHSDAAATTTYKRATDKPVQDGAQEQDSGARVIIIKVPRQDGSRPRRYLGHELVSAPHPYRPLICHLCM